MISKLFAIAKKPERHIIGLMSGTSLDGLDIALCRVSNSGRQTKVVLDNFTTIPYSEELSAQLREISAAEVSLSSLCYWNVELGRLYSRWISETLKKWKVPLSDVDLIASHGQTIYHLPRPKTGSTLLHPSTLQIADGDQIAAGTGIITVSDFRMKHIASGGEGAPLAGYGDLLLFSDEENDVVLLNIGGISNFTWLPKSKGAEIECSDIGPGNTLIDAVVRKHAGVNFDDGGKIAASGTIHPGLLAAFEKHPFLNLPFPKTTGPEEFNYDFVEQSLEEVKANQISTEDLTATITRFTANNIIKALVQVGGNSRFNLFISGGGLKNKTLSGWIEKGLPNARLMSTEKKGVLPDAKEALLFALLANECIAGNPETFRGTGLIETRMGKISFPN